MSLAEIGNSIHVEGETAARGGSLVERLFLVMLAILTAFILVGHLRAYATTAFVPEDLGAFYCAGQVVLHRQDPYRVGPLLGCERQLASIDPRWNTELQQGVNAAPLPSYDFIPLAALATLPVRVAVTIFGFLLLCATGVIGYCLARMSALPLIAAFAVAFVGVTYGSAPYGQLAPLAIAAVAAAALLLRLGKQRRAALAASVALIQPQFGLPIVIATFLFVPRARFMLAMIVVALALCGVGAVGWHGMIEYLSVLQIQARAELNAPFQYSLTWLLHALGASATIALVAGSVSYVVLLALCLFVLARSGERALASGAVILLPAAFAVFGGTYVHMNQVSVALLAAIVLASRTRIVLAPLLAAALLTVPFPSIKLAGLTALSSMLLMLTAAWCVVFFPARISGIRTAATSAVIVTTLIALLIALSLAFRPADEAARLANIDVVHHANAIASLEAEEVNNTAATRDRTPVSYYLLRKLPTWCGVAMTLWFSCSLLLSGVQPVRKPRWSTTVERASPSRSA